TGLNSSVNNEAQFAQVLTDVTSGTDTSAHLFVQGVTGGAGGRLFINDDATNVYLRLTGAQFRLASILSPSQITSNQDDYSPTGLNKATILRLSSDASRDITGLAGGASGITFLVFNVGSNNIVLKD